MFTQQYDRLPAFPYNHELITVVQKCDWQNKQEAWLTLH